MFKFTKKNFVFLILILFFINGCGEITAPLKKVNLQTKKIKKTLKKINKQSTQIDKSIAAVNELVKSTNLQNQEVEKILSSSALEKELVTLARNYVALIYNNTYKMQLSFARQVVINKKFYTHTKNLQQNLKKGEKENLELEKLLQEALILNQ